MNTLSVFAIIGCGIYGMYKFIEYNLRRNDNLDNIVAFGGSVIITGRSHNITRGKEVIEVFGDNLSVGDYTFKNLKITKKDSEIQLLDPIKIVGTCDRVSTISGNINIHGKTDHITTVSGDVTIDGNVITNVKTVSGDVHAQSYCSVLTISGDII